jgi:hypothetical protein
MSNIHREEFSSYRTAAMGAESESSVERAAAATARRNGVLRGVGRPWRIEDATAFFASRAEEKRLPFFHPQQRNEKEAEIMVETTMACLIKAARGTTLRRFFHGDDTGRYAGDQKHGPPF